MTQISRKIFIFIAFFQLITGSVSAHDLSNGESGTRIVSATGWSLNGLASDLSRQLDNIQKEAREQHLFFDCLEISLTNGTTAYVLYNVTNTGETNPYTTKISSVTGWSTSSITEKLQNEVDSIQNFAFSNNKTLEFKDLIVRGLVGFIIYEISE